MKAFHGDQAIKDKYLNRVADHRKADRLIRGTGWMNGRGCAVGCTLEKYEHTAYETELGIPQILARLEDRLFESLPLELAMAWPERFLAAIQPGADLSKVWHHFIIWLLGDATHGTMRLCDPRGAEATKRVIELYQREIAGEPVDKSTWRDAAAHAAYAADAAAHAAAADAYAAYAADAADAAYAADAAADAYADAAAYAADAKTRESASLGHYVRMADKLIELLEKA